MVQAASAPAFQCLRPRWTQRSAMQFSSVQTTWDGIVIGTALQQAPPRSAAWFHPVEAVLIWFVPALIRGKQTA